MTTTFVESVQDLWEATQWDAHKNDVDDLISVMHDAGVQFADHPLGMPALTLQKAVHSENPRASYEAVRAFKAAVASTPKREVPPSMAEWLDELEGFIARSVMSRRGAEKKGKGYTKKVAFDILDAWTDGYKRARTALVNEWDAYYPAADIRKALKYLETDGYIERFDAGGGGRIEYIQTDKAHRRSRRQGRKRATQSLRAAGHDTASVQAAQAQMDAQEREWQQRRDRVAAAYRDPFWNNVYDILTTYVGADPGERREFLNNTAVDEAAGREPANGEYRFMGDLGFGGKLFTDEMRVSQYAEDETPESIAAIEQANQELTRLVQSHGRGRR